MTRLQKCDRGLKPLDSLVSLIPTSNIMTRLQKCDRGLKLCISSMISKRWVWPDYRNVIGDWNAAVIVMLLVIFTTWPDYRNVIGDWNVLIHNRSLKFSIWPDYRNVIGDWNGFPNARCLSPTVMTRLQKCDRGLKPSTNLSLTSSVTTMTRLQKCDRGLKPNASLINLIALSDDPTTEMW